MLVTFLSAFVKERGENNGSRTDFCRNRDIIR